MSLSLFFDSQYIPNLYSLIPTPYFGASGLLRSPVGLSAASRLLSLAQPAISGKSAMAGLFFGGRACFIRSNVIRFIVRQAMPCLYRIMR